jgi:hypothetical protein
MTRVTLTNEAATGQPIAAAGRGYLHHRPAVAPRNFKLAVPEAGRSRPKQSDEAIAFFAFFAAAWLECPQPMGYMVAV